MEPSFIRNLGRSILIQMLSLAAIVVVGGGIVYAWSTIDRNSAASGQPLTSTMMQAVIDRLNDALVPTGAVMAFNLASCPTGWNPADGTSGRPDLRGEFIRGLDNGRLVDSPRTLGSWQWDILKSHNHQVYQHLAQITIAWVMIPYMNWSDVWQWTTNTFSTWWTETRPRNVALLYCMKN